MVTSVGPKQLSLEDISAQATAYNSTVYVGGISLYTSEELIRQKFVPHGTITDIRVFADKGYAFVKFVRHEEAACAIWQCNGTELAGSVIKCSWGREDPAVLMQVQNTCWSLGVSRGCLKSPSILQHMLQYGMVTAQKCKRGACM
jgi:RNA recognition motif-containing protein